MSDKNQMDRIEDLLTQLIKNVASVRSDMADFRSEVNQRFERVEHNQEDLTAQVALLNRRMDYQLNRIAKAEEKVQLLKDQQ